MITVVVQLKKKHRISLFAQDLHQERETTYIDLEISIFFFNRCFKGRKMNSERRPLLASAEMQSRTDCPRPDLRQSPENAIVDVQHEEDGEFD